MPAAERRHFEANGQAILGQAKMGLVAAVLFKTEEDGSTAHPTFWRPNASSDAGYKLFLYLFSGEKLDINVTRVTAHQPKRGQWKRRGCSSRGEVSISQLDTSSLVHPWFIRW
jgi:hypothetical protein